MNFNRYINVFAILAAGVMAAACSARGDRTGVEYAPQMYHSVPYEGLVQVTDYEAGRWLTSTDEGAAEFYTSNPNNPHSMNMREPVANTVRRGDYLPYRIPKDSIALAGRVLKNPLDSTESVVAEGKVLFSRYCQHCHGEQGLGDGLVGKVFKGVTPYNSRAVKDKPEGHIFHVITHGKGRMGSHASQVSVEDRWKIVRFVQTLQKQ
ncbi:c-type cytochrome [Reichenbachiella versicolor]|uniref:c-type cytochrome n=1 Tax=Reichenbachiella versicolor TaxID=1821036 RepID=UPI000D6E2F3B|nr:cytochrome c [Reichenbachiella versicolor]